MAAARNALVLLIGAGGLCVALSAARAGNETAPLDRSLLEAAARGDLQSARVALGHGAHVDARDERSATALMISALHGHAAVVAALLERGADPNAKNGVGATALMWGVQNLDSVRALVDHGANVNLRTDFGQTALMVAAGSDALSEVARFLIERGANVNAASKSGFTPLMSAISGGDADLADLLLKRGANAKARNKAGWTALHAAACVGDDRTVERLLEESAAVNSKAVKGFGSTPLMWAAARGATNVVHRLLSNGAAVNVRESFHGATALTWAAACQGCGPETVKALLAAGANPRSRDDYGDTARTWAVRQGNPDVIRLLAPLVPERSVPATASSTPPPGSPRDAVDRSLPLLQRAGPSFLAKAPEGCVSCHHQSLPAMAIALAQQKGFQVDATIVRQQAQATLDELEPRRDLLLTGIGVPDPLDPAYFLVGLAAAKQSADSTTDAMVHYLTLKQARDGRWRSALHRPPIDDSDFTNTAVSLRAIQAFAPKGREREVAQRIQRAVTWLASAEPKTTEDRVFQILGLHWGGADAARIKTAREQLISGQHSDGGWSQLPGLESDAYATGQVLFALAESGEATSEPGYQRGVKFLLKSQWKSGSWRVLTRALPIQPYFESGFPHGRSQFISIAATAWATMALSLAIDGDDPANTRKADL